MNDSYLQSSSSNVNNIQTASIYISSPTIEPSIAAGGTTMTITAVNEYDEKVFGTFTIIDPINELRFQHCVISADIWLERIQTGISQGIEALTFEECTFKASVPIELFDGSWSQLQHLTFSHCKFINSYWPQTEFGQTYKFRMPRLTSLVLIGTKINDFDLGSVLKATAQTGKLEHLELYSDVLLSHDGKLDHLDWTQYRSIPSAISIFSDNLDIGSLLNSNFYESELNKQFRIYVSACQVMHYLSSKDNRSASSSSGDDDDDSTLRAVSELELVPLYDETKTFSSREQSTFISGSPVWITADEEDDSNNSDSTELLDTSEVSESFVSVESDDSTNPSS